MILVIGIWIFIDERYDDIIVRRFGRIFTNRLRHFDRI